MPRWVLSVSLGALLSTFFAAASSPHSSPHSSHADSPYPLNILASKPIRRSEDPENYLGRRDEAYQPTVAPLFPNLLGPARLLKWMDQHKDPCNDFFNYACGGFDELYHSQQTSDVLGLMQESNSLLMQQLLNKPVDKLAETPVEHELVGKLNRYYTSCLNGASISKRDFSPIIPLAKYITYVSSRPGITLPQMLGELNVHAVYPFFKVVYTKIEGRSFDDLELEMYPSYGYKVTKDTIEIVLKLFAEAGVIKFHNYSTLEKVVEWVYQLEKEQLSFVSASNTYMQERVAKDEQTITISELNSKTELDWNSYLDALNLTGIEKVHLWGEVGQFESMLKSVGKMSPEDLNYYYLWRAAAAHFNKLSETYWNLWSTDIYSNMLSSAYEDGQDQLQVFQSDCVTEIGMHLNFLSGYLFINYAFNATQKSTGTELVDDIISAARRSISDLNWMDETTKSAALKKLDSMKQIVGYPDWLSDGELISQYYSSIDFESEKYFENAVAAQAFGDIYPSIYQLKKQIEAIKSNEPELQRDSIFFGYPWQLNAFHLTDLNQMQINPGILQRPLFSALNEPVMNYGSLGSIIGHEITHAFDSMGRKINYNGEAKDWWKNAANESFTLGAQCFIDQYNKLFVTLKNGEKAFVNGEQTLPENIADNGGLDLALDAWRTKVARDHGETGYRKDWGLEKSPGFNGLTAEQVFFISYAQTWCAVQKDSDVLSLIKSDAHAPNPTRVQGVLQNSVDFQNAFSCKLEDRYVAKEGDSKRCYLY